MKRQLQRGALALALCLFGLAFCGAEAVRAEGVISVTTTDDGIAEDGFCSLREAVIAANTDSPVGGCAGGSGADTILFDEALARPALFLLSVAGVDENSAQSGDLDLKGTVTISGTNAADQIIIDGNQSDRVFEILSSAHVTMIGVTIRHGNSGSAAGGGVLVDLTARLTIANSQLISNSALSGGGLAVLGGLTINASRVAENQGGGIDNQGGLVTLTNVDVVNNRGGYGIQNRSQGVLTYTMGELAENQGGGLYNAAARATLTRITLRANSGSGAVNSGASLTRLTIADSQILSNTAAVGGGLLNEGTGASVDIYTTRISGNQAMGSGGALFNNGLMTVQGSTLDHNQARAGAGLHHFGGNLSLLNDTISHNNAEDNGGGIYIGGSAVLNAVTVAQNQAGGAGGNIFLDEASMSIEQSIVALAQSGGNCVKSGGFFTSLGHNLESAHSCNFNATGDIIDREPLLGPLQANGGRAPTHALLKGSPAIDGGAATCPATDQRGVLRPQGSGCDIGAYEFAASADLAMVAHVAPITITVGTRLTYTLTISNLGPLTATALLLTDEMPTGTTVLTATIADGICMAATPLTCTVAQLVPGQMLTATIVLTAPLSTGPITNTALITATTADLFLENNFVETVVSVTTPADLTPPGPVTNLTVTAVTTQGATLTWDAAIDNVGVAGYAIYAQKSGISVQARAGVQPLLLVGQISGTTTTFTVTCLVAQTAYQLWVVAYDAAGNVAPLAEATPVAITTLALSVGVVQISIEPPLPTDHEPISITISGVYTSSCTPHYQAHQRIDHLIAITSVPSDELFCLPAEFPWGYTVGLPALSAGRYTVTHTLGQVVDQRVFTVAVAESPSLPIFHVAGNQAYSAVVGEVFRLLIQASGTPTLTYALVDAPAGMTIGPTSGQIAWAVPLGSAEAVTITVRATNDLGSADYRFTILMQTPRSDQIHLFLPWIAKP